MSKKIQFFGFGVHCCLRIFCFSAFDFRFSRKILTGFRIWYPIQFLVFPILPIWVPVSILFAQQLRASTDLKQPLNANVTKRNAWQTIWNITGIPRGFTRLEWRPRLWPSVGVQASWMTLRDFDLAMWSTWVKVKQFANHVFQYAKCAGNGQRSWTLKSNFTLLYWNLLHVENSIGNWRRKHDDVPLIFNPNKY